MADYFDYGGEVAVPENNIKLWPTEGNRTALVDADLLPYRVGHMIDPMKYLQAQALVLYGTCSCIEETPQFESAFDSLCSTLNKWVKSAKCDSALLYATDSKANYRLDLAYTTDYKGQRLAEKPPFFYELKNKMVTELGCIMSDGNEADDDLSIEAMSRFKLLEAQGIKLGSPMHKELCDTVTCSSDKDSTITSTWHYNPDTNKLEFTTELGDLRPKYVNKEVNHYEYFPTGKIVKGKPQMKRLLIGKKPSDALKDLKGSGLKFFYAQILMGDATDNYKGLPNHGMTFAFNTLDKCKTEKELYMAVLLAYKNHYGEGTHVCTNHLGKTANLTAYDRMLEQGRLAHMQHYKGEIWREQKGRVIKIDDKEIWSE